MQKDSLFLDKSTCNGCNLCAYSCKCSAIEMKQDSEGFMYPFINENKGIDCGLCLRVCPQKNVLDTSNITSNGYAFIHTNKEVLQKCTSGGAFIGIVDWFFQTYTAPVVYGCSLEHDSNKELYVRHSRVTSFSECIRFTGSKYVQSDLNGIYDQIHKDLEDGRSVLFSGTPCQVVGIYKAFKNWHASGRLVLVDIICHAVPSPLIFKEHLRSLENVKNKKIENYTFRFKIKGWGHTEVATFTDQTRIYNRKVQRLKELFYKDFTTRHSCSKCKYCGPSRVSDFTIGDFWGIERVQKSLNNANGVSFMIVHTVTGQNFVDKYACRHIIHKVDVLQGYKYNHSKPISLNSKRSYFWRDYHERGYDYASRKYTDGYIKRLVKTIIRVILPEDLRLKLKKMIIH